MSQSRIFLLKEDSWNNTHSVCDEIVGFTYDEKYAKQWVKDCPKRIAREYEEIKEITE